ncbi:16S rRNA (cytosine(1402)-N(4))-methyltransferase RsmH [Poriferisphaera sp. WC338]|uniref:16S rRNA (cytosine(1402)-N(4))-methyltransferase RsmH n=1 Tax=Poriferisphaera sp. WC338 TaxID=3425129 RepID=UPI003D81AA4B
MDQDFEAKDAFNGAEVGHKPVLWREVMSLLAPQPGETVLDCTAGRGGHGEMLTRAIGNDGAKGTYIGMDVDPLNADFARNRLQKVAHQLGDHVQINIINRNFTEMDRVLQDLNIHGTDIILADLGFASNQMDDGARGMSFREDGPLDMRLDTTGDGVTAAELVNELDETELADVIYQFGEERLSRRIARKIVEKRKDGPIESTCELAELVRGCYPGGGRKSRIHPATRTFMALRIAVNGELAALDHFLATLSRESDLVKVGGRVGVISFHSLEDRRVKLAFRALKQRGDWQLINRKVVIAQDDECNDNPRSRSAKLRVIKRVR